MSTPLHLQFVTSAPSVDQLPEAGPEVAVVGRSNVGKSSLINALANRKRLAHVSNTPGRTQLLNLYAHRPAGALMDLPGYGFAAVPARVRVGWQPMIEGYLLGREALVMVVVLVDGEVGPTKLDAQMLEWLRAEGLPHTVVATKADRVKPSKRDQRRRDVAAGCMLEPDDVLWVSATKGTGLDVLRARVRHWLTATTR